MKNKILLLTALILLNCNLSFTQQNTEQMAFAGSNGIFIINGMEIPFASSGKDLPFRYRIERSNANQNNWIEIAQISAPENYDSFIRQIYNLNKTLTDSIPANELPLETIWQKAKRYERLDSLKYFGNPLIVRLALGVCFLDKQVSEGTKYAYRISKLDKDNRVMTSFLTNDISFPGTFQNNKMIVNSKESSENSIRINWVLTEGNNPARFKVFRRMNFEGDFSEIFPQNIYNSNDTDILFSIVDSTVSPNNVYEYYALPVDYYQNPGIASDTVAVPAYSFNKLFPPYDITVTGLDSIGALVLKWKQDENNKLISVKIFRSKYFDKDFEAIAEVTGLDSFYVDRTAEPMTKYYYYLELNDPFSEALLSSAKVFGLYKSSEIPPPPFLLNDVASVGVKLVWNKPDDFVNTYHIYRKISDESSFSEFAMVNSQDSIVTFTDTSLAINGNLVYYSVRSGNTSGNISEFSDTLQVFPVSVIPLNAPKEIKGYAQDGMVYLYWENMFADNPNIEGYKVFRKSKSDQNINPNFVALFDTLIPPKQNNFIDTTVVEGDDYNYAVKAFDISGNESEYSSTIEIKIPEIPILPPSGLTVTNRDDGILIRWDAPVDNNIKQIKIFRYERGVDPNQIGIVNLQDSEFIDTTPVKGNLYFYFITSVSNSGIESNPSEELGIRRE